MTKPLDTLIADLASPDRQVRMEAIWTLKKFGEPKLLTGIARKENVLAHFLGRGESEIVIDPAKVNKKNVSLATKKK